MHIDTPHYTDNQWNCEQCDLQATIDMALRKHINHSLGNTNSGTLNYRLCNNQLSNKWNLMNHRKISIQKVLCHVVVEQLLLHQLLQVRKSQLVP